MLAIVGWNPDAPHKKRVELDMNYQLGAGLKVMGRRNTSLGIVIHAGVNGLAVNL